MFFLKSKNNIWEWRYDRHAIHARQADTSDSEFIFRNIFYIAVSSLATRDNGSYLHPLEIRTALKVDFFCFWSPFIQNRILFTLKLWYKGSKLQQTSLIHSFILQHQSFTIHYAVVRRRNVNIARGTTDPGIASITWIIFPATNLGNSVARKIQVKYLEQVDDAASCCIVRCFNHCSPHCSSDPEPWTNPAGNAHGGAVAVCMCGAKQKYLVDKKQTAKSILCAHSMSHTLLERYSESIFTHKRPKNKLLTVDWLDLGNCMCFRFIYFSQ